MLYATRAVVTTSGNRVRVTFESGRLQSDIAITPQVAASLIQAMEIKLAAMGVQQGVGHAD